PYKILNPENLDSKLRRIDGFLEKEFNFDYIKQRSNNFIVIHGDDDDRVPFEHAEFISRNLNCKLVSVPNGGHLNGKSGWKQLPQAFDALKEFFK
ncbi:MAG: alpha/beta hydrolase, partial [Candidatus Nomurabacteria bacterium]|nr:alpha/beta hydrolase [Candidatus Nomurabacteria bacterium]